MTATKDYIVQGWFNGKMVDETLLTEVEFESAEYEAETMRANYPGIETRFYPSNADVQGGTVTVSNLRRI